MNPARKLRIVFVIDSLQIGGTELNALRTARRLLARGHSLVLVHLAADGPILTMFEEMGAETRYFPMMGLAKLSTLLSMWRFSQFLRSVEPDVVHTQDVFSNIFGAPAARLAGVRRIVVNRRWLAKVGRPVLGIVNRLASSCADVIATNSESAAAIARRESLNRGTQVHLTPNFIDLAVSAERADLVDDSTRRNRTSPLTARRIGCVAQLRPIKRHDLLLRTFALLSRDRNVSLTLVGDGPEREKLEQLAAELGVLDRLTFAGQIADNAEIHSSFEVSVLLSDAEGCPNSLFEAAALNVPIVATRVGGIADTFVHERNALLVQAGDVTGARDAIARLLDDEMLAEKLAANAKSLLADFSPERAINEVEVCYGLSSYPQEDLWARSSLSTNALE